MAWAINAQVPLSGVVASLLLRLGRMLNVMPKSAGPDSLNLSCAPLPNGGLEYVGLVSEIPASYAASTSLITGCFQNLSLIFQTTASKRTLTRKRTLSFDVPC